MMEIRKQSHPMMGREKEVQSEAEKVRRLNPRFSVYFSAKLSGYKDHLETDRILAPCARQA
jgi:hypothetical protein